MLIGAGADLKTTAESFKHVPAAVKEQILAGFS